MSDNNVGNEPFIDAIKKAIRLGANVHGDDGILSPCTPIDFGAIFRGVQPVPETQKIDKDHIVTTLRQIEAFVRNIKEEPVCFPEIKEFNSEMHEIVSQMDGGYLTYGELGELLYYITDMME